MPKSSATTNLPYFTLQSNNQMNNQIIKTNNQLFKVTIMQIGGCRQKQRNHFH